MINIAKKKNKQQILQQFFAFILKIAGLFYFILGGFGMAKAIAINEDTLIIPAIILMMIGMSLQHIGGWK